LGDPLDNASGECLRIVRPSMSSVLQ
jgi:hypothetical protein